MLPIFCISLQRKRKERYLNLKNNFFDPMNLDVIEWVATDANNYKNSYELSKQNNLKLSEYGKELNKSVIATAVSHRSLWKFVIENDIESAIILEDDVYIYDNFENNVINIWSEIKNDDNINFLLLSFSDNIIIDPKFTSYNNIINKVRHFNGLFCYLVKKQGAYQLLELTDNLSYQIDIQLSKKNLSYFALKNKVAYYQENSITTIHNHRFKLLEVYFGLEILNYKLIAIIDFYVMTFFSIIMIFIGIILANLKFNFLFVDFINMLALVLDLKLVGARFDELDYRIKGILNIGSYDSDEVANKIVDHLLLSITFTLFSFLL